MNIALAGGWRTAQGSAATEWYFSSVLIYRMRSEIAKRRSGFDTNSGSQGQILEEGAGEGVADEVVENVPAVGVEETNGELIPGSL